MSDSLSPRDLLEVLLKDYEVQRGYVTVFWQMLGAWIALLLSAAGFALYYGVTERKRLLVAVVPLILLAGTFVVVFWTRENYYANVYMACVEQEIQGLLKGVCPPVEPLGWISEVTVQASGVNDYGAIPGAALLVLFQVVSLWALVRAVPGVDEGTRRPWKKLWTPGPILGGIWVVLAVLLAVWDLSTRADVREQVLVTKPCCDRDRVP